jgi:uncharacterized protein
MAKTIKARFIKGGWEKIVGLLQFEDENIYFRTRFGIHTFGMKRPIDVLILDKDNKVVKSAGNLKPWRFMFWNPKYDKVVELQSGLIKRKRLNEGDLLKIKFD